MMRNNKDFLEFLLQKFGFQKAVEISPTKELVVEEAKKSNEEALEEEEQLKEEKR